MNNWSLILKNNIKLGSKVKILRNGPNKQEFGKVVGIKGEIASVDFKDWKYGHQGFEGMMDPLKLELEKSKKTFGRWNFIKEDLLVIDGEQLEFDFDDSSH
jgi:hypothetical protein